MSTGVLTLQSAPRDPNQLMAVTEGRQGVLFRLGNQLQLFPDDNDATAFLGTSPAQQAQAIAAALQLWDANNGGAATATPATTGQPMPAMPAAAVQQPMMPSVPQPPQQQSLQPPQGGMPGMPPMPAVQAPPAPQAPVAPIVAQQPAMPAPQAAMAPAAPQAGLPPMPPMATPAMPGQPRMAPTAPTTPPVQQLTMPQMGNMAPSGMPGMPAMPTAAVPPTPSTPAPRTPQTASDPTNSGATTVQPGFTAPNEVTRQVMGMNKTLATALKEAGAKNTEWFEELQEGQQQMLHALSVVLKTQIYLAEQTLGTDAKTLAKLVDHSGSENLSIYLTAFKEDGDEGNG